MGEKIINREGLRGITTPLQTSSHKWVREAHGFQSVAEKLTNSCNTNACNTNASNTNASNANASNTNAWNTVEERRFSAA